MTADEHTTRQELGEIENYLTKLREHIAIVEGHRDQLLARLMDNEGADSARFVAAR